MNSSSSPSVDPIRPDAQDPLAPMTDSANSPDIMTLAWGIKHWLLAGAVVGVVLGQLVYMKLGPLYESKGQILVARKTTTPVKERDAEAAAMGERAEHIALIMSPLIIDAAVKKHSLDQLPSVKGAPDPAREIIDYLKVRRSAGQDRTVLNVLDITYVSPKRGDGLTIVQAVIDAYRDYLVSSRNSVSQESSQTHADAAKKLTEELDEIQKKQKEFRRNAPLHWKTAPGVDGNTSDYTNEQQDRMLALDTERRLTTNKLVEVKANIATLEEALRRNEPRDVLEFLVRRLMNSNGSNSGDRLGDVVGLQNRLLPLLLDEQKLLRSFDEDHPEVKTIRKEIAMVRDFYRRQGVVLPEVRRQEGNLDSDVPTQDIVTLYLESLKKEKITLEARDKELTALYDDAALKSKKYVTFLVEDQRFTDEIKWKKKLLEEVTTRLSVNELSQKNGGFSLQQIAPVMEELQFKRQLQFLLLGAIGCMIGIFGMFYLKALQDNTLKSAEELRSRFGFNVVGQVPEFDPERITVGAFPKLDRSLSYAHQPGSLEAEAYRTIRTSLFFSTQGQGRQVIQVTSAEPQDGKTTLCGNLALAIANSGKRILLIDADLRCPRVHQLFGEALRPGLSDVLSGEISLEEAVITMAVPGLHLLCAGTRTSNPSEMLGSGAFERVIQQAREKYDYVLVDSPPMLVVSDPCVISSQCNGLMLVFRRGKNRLSAVRETRELVQDHRMRVLGVVLNGLETLPEGDYGYSYRERYVAQPQSKPGMAPALTAGSGSGAGRRS